jgi:hypothetical protein
LVNPKQLTIDYCQAEINAIQATFSPTALIQFCICHVAQVWHRKIKDCVKGASKIIHCEMMSNLIKMVYEEDIEQFHQQINELHERYIDEVKFLDYIKEELAQ